MSEETRRGASRRVLLIGLLQAWAIRTPTASAETATYTYDDLGRLIRVEYSTGAAIEYAYDLNGNRTEMDVTSGVLGTFNASPAAIATGNSAALTWTSSNATSASIDNAVGAVSPVAGGSVNVSPSTTTTYRLTLNGPLGELVRETTVVVAPAPNGTLSASPSSIVQGNSATLSWTSTNAQAASINNGVGPVSPVAGGSINVSPTATTTYTLTLSSAVGNVTKQATVTVTPPGFNATIAITSGPANLRSLANAAGYNGTQDATITFTVASGVTITGAAGSAGNAGGAGIDTGIWPGGYNTSLTLQNAGVIRGGGGGGNSGAGGDAIYARTNLTINNTGGVLQGGGGGGGFGGGWVFIAGENQTNYLSGGGGGGFPNGAAGPEGNQGAFTIVDAANAGSAGTTSGGGAGGAGNGSVTGGRTTGAGGSGGGAAQTGASGVAATGTQTTGAITRTKSGQGAGGAAGYAVRKNGHTVSRTGGTVAGAES